MGCHQYTTASNSTTLESNKSELGTLFGTDASHRQEGDLAAGDTSVVFRTFRTSHLNWYF